MPCVYISYSLVTLVVRGVRVTDLVSLFQSFNGQAADLTGSPVITRNLYKCTVMF